MHKRRYGMDWDGAIPDHQIELILWQRRREEPYFSRAQFRNPVADHFLTGCRMLFTPKQLALHPWFERMANAYTDYRETILIGAASSGKSHFSGICLLLDYLTDPQELYACLVSTSKDMLMLRSFASVIEYLGYLRGNAKLFVPFKYVAQRCAVVPDGLTDDQMLSHKAMIKGVAIREGSVEDAKAAIKGVHLPRTRVCADEFEDMKDRAKAFLEAQDNLIVCRDYKALYTFNPFSLYSPGCKLATPKDGWTSVNESTDEWVTATGARVLRFDGHKSPGLRYPDLFPFLPNKKTIADILARNHGNEDSPGYWSFVRAFPPMQAEERTVLTEKMVMAYNMLEPIVFRDSCVKVAALDPAFTSDGDDCVLVIAKVGMSVLGVMTILFDRVYFLKIKVTDPTPVTSQIVNQVLAIMEDEDFTIDHFGVDDSGTQSVADAIAEKTENTLYRCNFSTKPPELSVSSTNLDLASKKYRNTVTWLYYLIQEYGLHGQIKGLPKDAAEEFCKRRVSSKQQPHALEGKKDAKKHLGRSPDTGDACAIIAGLCRERLGVVPGGNAMSVHDSVRYRAWAIGNEPLVQSLNNLKTEYIFSTSLLVSCLIFSGC
jgi:hypothetical protein